MYTFGHKQNCSIALLISCYKCLNDDYERYLVFFLSFSAIPRRSNNQRLHCTNIKVNEKTNTSLFKAVLCDERHSVLCETSGKGMIINLQYCVYVIIKKSFNHI